MKLIFLLRIHLMTEVTRILRHRLKCRMFYLPAVLCSLFIISAECRAQESFVDVSGYLGKTVQDVMDAFPGMWMANDEMQSGRDYVTDGRICFYYEYLYNFSNEQNKSIYDQTVNRIVLNEHCGMEYRIGNSFCVGATPTDEDIYLQNMGYEKILETGDYRNIWRDAGGHLIIVTRGPFAGASAVDYCFVHDVDYGN